MGAYHPTSRALCAVCAVKEKKVEKKKVPGVKSKNTKYLRGTKSSSCLAKVQRMTSWQNSGELSSILRTLNFILREMGSQRF